MTPKEQVLEILKQIEPGKNYPANVEVREMVDGKLTKIKFCLCSYFVGMYCAIHVDDSRMPHQTGDYGNKRFVRGLKKDLLKAVARGAEVEIGALWDCKLMME